MADDIHIDPSWFIGIVDLSHSRAGEIDFAGLKDAGIRAVVHKATEGADIQDPRYKVRRDAAKKVGLLWGAYHYAGLDATPADKQVKNFLDYADPDPGDFVAFDCEKHGTFENMLGFCKGIRASTKLARYPAIYGRNLLTELMKGKGGSEVSKGILWFDDYYPHSLTPYRPLPEGWTDWTLWQYTDGKHGILPRVIAGKWGFDRSAYRGTEAEFVAAWPFIRT